MKKKIGGIGLCMLAWSILTCAQTITPHAEQRAKDIVSKMTLQEKIEYISGYTSFSLRAIPRLGIPEIKLADGPQGIRNPCSQEHFISFRNTFRFYLEPGITL